MYQFPYTDLFTFRAEVPMNKKADLTVGSERETEGIDDQGRAGQISIIWKLMS